MTEYSDKSLLLKISAYPTNASVKVASGSEFQFKAGHGVARPARTYAFNAPTQLHLTLDDFPELLASHTDVRHVTSWMVLHGTGILVVCDLFELAAPLSDKSEALQLLQDCFYARRAVYPLIERTFKSLAERKIITEFELAPFDVLGESQVLRSGQDARTAIESEFDLRAWGTNVFINLSETERELLTPVEHLVDLPRGSGAVHAAAEDNVFVIDTPGRSIQQAALLDAAEPLALMLGKLSICTSASWNLRNISEEFVRRGKSDKRHLDLRRYMALVDINIHRIDEYLECSDKEYRRVFRSVCEHNQAERCVERLERGEAAVSDAISASEEQMRRISAKVLNFFVILFTGLAIVSVVADAVGLVDARASMLEYRDRILLLIAASTAVALVSVFALFQLIRGR